MEIIIIILPAILLFIIIYSSVRLAIKPLLPEITETEIDKSDDGLVKLRDIEVLSNIELEEIIELYHSKSVKTEHRQQYEKYSKVLNELKEIGFLTHEDYNERMEKLKGYFNNHDRGKKSE